MPNTYDLKSKVQRAIASLLVGQGAAGSTWQNTFAGEYSSGNRDLPNTSIECLEGVEEDFTGNYRFHGRIVFRDDATLQPNVASPQTPFLNARQRVDQIIGLLVQTEDATTMDYSRMLINLYGNALAVDASNGAISAATEMAEANSDMTDFSMLYWRVTDYGQAQKMGAEGGLYFEREIGFECVACNLGGFDSSEGMVFAQVSDGQLVPLVDDSGNVIASRFIDQVTGKLVYVRVVDGQFVLSSE
jgi:hypothetical protein